MNCAPSVQNQLLDDPSYVRLKEHLVKSTGLAYYADKDADLARRLGRRLTSVGRTGIARRTSACCAIRCGVPPELDALIAEITIGETHFFRHTEHFEALRDIVLPGLTGSKWGQSRLRIWCAGCADGAGTLLFVDPVEARPGASAAGMGSIDSRHRH